MHTLFWTKLNKHFGRTQGEQPPQKDSSSPSPPGHGHLLRLPQKKTAIKKKDHTNDVQMRGYYEH